MATHPSLQTALNLCSRPRVGECRCANLHSIRAGEHEFDGMFSTGDSPDTNDRNLRMRRPHVEHASYRNGMNR